MSLNIVETRTNTRCPVPFKFAVVGGTPADHASWWSFDDEQEVRDRWWHPKAGETVLDIGAAFGSYVLPALAMGARVVAFSPAEFDTELLQANLDLNPELARRCLVLRDGLYSKAGWFDPDRTLFFEKKEGDGDGVGGYDLRGMVGHGEEHQLLPVRTLDEILDERPGIENVDWIKIDVEAAELEVLKGAEKTIRLGRPRILVENHEFIKAGIGDQVRDFLIGLNVGYVCDGPVQHHAVSHSFFEARQ